MPIGPLRQAFPWLRTFTPWSGHSYAGGLGNTGNGNGQESTSESMQGWGGVYLLGVALGDKAMRDAGIFGWVTESKGVAEYWFDRDKENIDRTLYAKPYCSNLTAAGIGWWTWFPVILSGCIPSSGCPCRHVLTI